MGRTKVERLGAGAESVVSQMRAQNKGYRTIAEVLSKTFGEEISHQAVKNYWTNEASQRQKQLGEQNAQSLMEDKIEEIIDTGSQLEKINRKINKALDTLDEQERADMGLLINLSKELRAHIKLHKQFIEEVVQPSTQINQVEVNNTQNTQNIMMEFNEYLNELQKKKALVCDKCGHRHVTIDAQKI